MTPYRLSIIVGLSLILPACPAFAQSPAAKPKVPLDSAARRGKAEADRTRNERRLQARLLLISLANDARSFSNQTLRSRSLMRIADALWDADSEEGRAQFRRAWDAAETADRENTGPFELGRQPPNLREEVLRQAARRDRKLTEEFLQKLKTDQEETKTEKSEPSRWALPEASEQRLKLAKYLLRNGDMERALQFAGPVLGDVTVSTVEFITLLRDKDPSAADRRYAVMLANTNGNMLADANTISLLSSYIFTPGMFLIFNDEGNASSVTPNSPHPPASVSPQLRLAFFQTAAGFFLRPELPPEKDQSTTGIVGKYIAFKRLLPLFEQYAPGEITAAMHAQFEKLSALVSDSVRRSENEWVQKGLGPEKPLADQEHSLLEQIEHAGRSDERDELYFKLALLALSKDDMKARDYVSKIEKSGFRKLAQAWVDPSLAISAIKKKKIEAALELVQRGELTHIQRVWILTQAAKLVAKANHDRALSLLDDATAEARRIGGSDLDRPRGLLAIANARKLIEPARAWDAILDAVNAVNSTEGFTGEDGVLFLRVSSKALITVRNELVPDFDLEGIFGRLANDDYNRAVELARGFQAEAPRVNATVAIARSVFNQKSSPAPQPRAAAKD